MRPVDAPIDCLWPSPATALNDDDLLARLTFPAEGAWLRMNFVSSLDGAATRQERSGGLGDTADHRLFNLLRYHADVVLVAAGTVRTEGYGAMRVGDAAASWRVQRGLPPHPTFALVSRSLNLDPASPIFTDAPVRPLVYTVVDADPARRHALRDVADVVDVGARTVDAVELKRDLAYRGLPRIHCEGGPSLFGSFLAAHVIDALHLTVAPTLEAGSAKRITDDARFTPTDMELVTVLRSGSELLLHYIHPDYPQRSRP